MGQVLGDKGLEAVDRRLQDDEYPTGISDIKAPEPNFARVTDQEDRIFNLHYSSNPEQIVVQAQGDNVMVMYPKEDELMVDQESIPLPVGKLFSQTIYSEPDNIESIQDDLREEFYDCFNQYDLNQAYSEVINSMIDIGKYAKQEINAQDLDITHFQFHGEPNNLGDIEIFYADSDKEGFAPDERPVNSIKIPVKDGLGRYATPLSYVMAQQLLEGRSEKPRIDTGFSYKDNFPGKSHHKQYAKTSDEKLLEVMMEYKEHL